MKYEIFKRKLKWYETNPGCNFIYYDEITKLHFVIYYEGRREFQGASRTLSNAYARLKAKLSEVPPLDKFKRLSRMELEKTLTFKVLL